MENGRLIALFQAVPVAQAVTQDEIWVAMDFRPLSEELSIYGHGGAEPMAEFDINRSTQAQEWCQTKQAWCTTYQSWCTTRRSSCNVPSPDMN